VKSEMTAKKLAFVGLINNAGVSRRVPLEFHDEQDARQVFETNYWGMLRMTQLFLPLLRVSQGRIIQISSVNGLVSTPTSGIYATSKFAMEATSDALRREVYSHGVSVSVIEPGYVKSAIHESSKTATREVHERNPAMMDVYGQFFSEAQRQKHTNVNLALAPFPDTSTTPAILDAMFAEYPKTRYVVATAGPYPAFVLAWIMWLLPDRVVDAMIRAMF